MFHVRIKMLNSAYIVFPLKASLNDIKEALIKSNSRFKDEEKLNWIVSIPPDRHVRLNIVDITEYFDLEPDEMDALSQKLGEIGSFGIFVEMSSSEKEGKLAVEIVAKILDQVGGILIDQNGKYYSPAELTNLAFMQKGLYE